VRRQLRDVRREQPFQIHQRLLRAGSGEAGRALQAVRRALRIEGGVLVQLPHRQPREARHRGGGACEIQRQQ
jgi:hypothetical protein